MEELLSITNTVTIPESELSFTFSTSSGPGGQNVNKVSTRATLHFDVAATQSLSERQKEVVTRRLRTRITRDGVLRVVSQRYRSQRANREAAVERFVELLRDALYENPPRRPTGVPRAVRERRLTDKKHRSHLKRERSKPREPE
ncbi:MAG TPA: alternative ribosome rescue aminoacyl-tRNA hydrolase ArfB [Patescibacteria group bacterium]|nr:alternative ribosome rescue aminoacyl-tRNA hydrolase ArfB [Patescibacteria group bacterium]